MSYFFWLFRLPINLKLLANQVIYLYVFTRAPIGGKNNWWHFETFWSGILRYYSFNSLVILNVTYITLKNCVLSYIINKLWDQKITGAMAPPSLAPLHVYLVNFSARFLTVFVMMKNKENGYINCFQTIKIILFAFCLFLLLPVANRQFSDQKNALYNIEFYLIMMLGFIYITVQSFFTKHYEGFS